MIQRLLGCFEHLGCNNIPPRAWPEGQLWEHHPGNKIGYSVAFQGGSERGTPQYGLGLRTPWNSLDPYEDFEDIWNFSDKYTCAHAHTHTHMHAFMLGKIMASLRQKVLWILNCWNTSTLELLRCALMVAVSLLLTHSCHIKSVHEIHPFFLWVLFVIQHRLHCRIPLALLGHSKSCHSFTSSSDLASPAGRGHMLSA